jgi:4-amino-4-deoxychorismate lyase
MYPLFESIKLLDGKFVRLELHQARVDNSCKQLFNKTPGWRLGDLCSSADVHASGLYKCRVSYNLDFANIHITPYAAKPVGSLRLVNDDHISYPNKLQDRTPLNNAYARRGDCDDILIVKNGMVTDSFYANVVFEKGGKWFTPRSYLLAGTMRQYLLNEGLVEEAEITTENFTEYSKVKLINALLEWNGSEVHVSNIY